MNETGLYILPLGLKESGHLRILREEIQNIFKRTTHLLSPVPMWERAYNKNRSQYNSSLLIHYIRNVTGNKDRTLAVTDRDLYANSLNFVFGEADPISGTCIVSTRRLKNEFYNQKDSPDIFIERLVKEAVHELGHTFGLKHCSLPSCVMYFSNSIIDTDRKGKFFCNKCRKRVIR